MPLTVRDRAARGRARWTLREELVAAGRAPFEYGRP
jgi:hypothetical protein